MYLNKIYRNRYQDRRWREAMWKILVKNYFQQFISKKDIVADIACGYGEFINNINCRKKIAIDINPDAKKYLNKKVFYYRQSTINMFSIKDNSVDKVFVSNYFEHISREEIILTIKEIKRILKKEGQILVLQPNIRFLANNFWMFFDHITPVDDRALTEIIEASGFKLTKIILKFLPYTTESYFPRWPWLVTVYLKLSCLWQIFGKQSFLIFSKEFYKY